MNFFQFADKAPATAVIIVLIVAAATVGVAEAISKAFARRRP